MLGELVKFSEQATLIMRSGVQFMDFGLTLDLRKAPPGEFKKQSSGCSLARLEYDDRADKYVHPGNPSVSVSPTRDSVSVDESFKLLEGCWLPLPVLRAGPQRQFAEGPTTWARGRVIAIPEGEDLQRHTHRLTLAFDTNVFESMDDMHYLAPTLSDVQT
ncbi:MAG: virulence factor SrfB, partial [Rhodospirillales bacterium]|nr:virulence factor SrfB [Rhodospirillales bacterium]